MKTAPVPEISIVIVNYNTKELLRNCLESIRRSLTLPYEVIVSDNASSDASLELCAAFWEDPRFLLVRNGANLGFAKANNIGASRARGRILHFLNPDTEIQASMQDDYRRALEEPHAAYVNTLYNRNGTVENSRKPLSSLRDLFWWNVKRSKARYWYIGASVILSREDFDGIGGWSEDYFLYSEDLDLFHKLWQHEVPIKTLSSRIFHLGGGSSGRMWNTLEREIVVQRSYRIYFKKYYSKAEYIGVKLYFLLFTLLKHPSELPVYVKAWHRSRR